MITQTERQKCNSIFIQQGQAIPIVQKQLFVHFDQAKCNQSTSNTELKGITIVSVYFSSMFSVFQFYDFGTPQTQQ